MSNNFINKIYETGIVQDNQGNNFFALNSGIPYDEGRAIQNLIQKTKSLKTLEVGMAYGLSTLFFCEAHAENNIGGLHTAIDPDQEKVFNSIGLLNIKRIGLENYLRFYQASSYEILPELVKQQERFDFIFIDGMHVFDFALVDFFFADLLLKPMGFIMFDDLWMPSVRAVVRYILSNRHYRLDSSWISNPQPLLRRCFNFFKNDKARKIKMSLMLKHQIHRPLDFSPAYFALKGNLKYQVIQKISEDNRSWSYHKEF